MNKRLVIYGGFLGLFLLTGAVSADQTFTEDVNIKYSNDQVKLTIHNTYSTDNSDSPATLILSSDEGESAIHQWSADSATTAYSGRLVFETATDNLAGMLFTTNGPHDIEFTAYRSDSTDSNSTDPDMILHSTGHLSVGAAEPYEENGVTASLTVDGFVAVESIWSRQAISAGSLLVYPQQWADDVFEPDYPLLSLDDLQSHILQNRHLPGVPSEQEVVDNGVSVGEMQATLLRKVEELTLYVIEQQRLIDSQAQEIQDLKSHLLLTEELSAL